MSHYTSGVSVEQLTGLNLLRRVSSIYAIILLTQRIPQYVMGASGISRIGDLTCYTGQLVIDQLNGLS
jgi:hypothetical protein